MRKIILLIHLCPLALLFTKCAQQTSPTGGPKDTIPPILVDIHPRPGQINFKQKTITLEFDENVILNNPKDQIIITPDVDKKYEVKAKKRSVDIEFEEKLQDSTTYSINFRDAIQDITEKNPAKNLKLAFSTGSYIDSLSIKGEVREILKDAIPKDASVSLYQSDTFDIFKHKPTYVTKINKFGRFNIENLKPGTYYVYAFEDKNRNLIVDSKTESYAFATDSIQLRKNKILTPISLIRLDSRPLKLTSNRPYNSYSNIKTSKGLQSYQLKTTSGDSVRSCYGEDRSNIKIYNTFPNADSTQVLFSALDSIGAKIDTTFFIKFSKKNIEKEKFEFKIQQPKAIAAKRTLSATITFTKPVLDLNYDSIYIKIDSATHINLESTDFKWNSPTNTAHITKHIPAEYIPKNPDDSDTPTITKTSAAQWELVFNSAALLSVELDSSTSTKQNITITQPNQTGTILVNISTTSDRFIVQLLDKSYNIIQTSKNLKNFSFTDLPPSDYLLRVIDDRNGNGSWDPGNFKAKVNTEPIYYYRNEKKQTSITLKANWELGPLLIAF